MPIVRRRSWFLRVLIFGHQKNYLVKVAGVRFYPDNFGKFPGKQPWQSVLFWKVVDCICRRAATENAK